jgi:hypothetical protein
MRLAVKIEFSLTPPPLLLGGALFAVIAALCAIILIVFGTCGSDLSYYGCSTPSAAAPSGAPRL